MSETQAHPERDRWNADNIQREPIPGPGSKADGTPNTLGPPETSERYADAVKTYAERTKESFLNSGQHYKQLAQFLKPSLDLSVVAAGQSGKPYTHVTVRSLFSERTEQIDYDGLNGISDCSRLPPTDTSRTQLVSSEGCQPRDGLVWLDVGKDLYERAPGSWFVEQSYGRTARHTCRPVIQHYLKHDATAAASSAANPERPTSFGQTATLLPRQYGTSLSTPIMHRDAMYALSELFAFAAASESQFLNMMSPQIDDDHFHLFTDKKAFLAILQSGGIIIDLSCGNGQLKINVSEKLWHEL
ncbi:hypothetical protein MMC08_007740 [Hypocenomyce scalaris]|nr:hypothetical protein [Hypocenomyce scalaris]